MKKIAIILALAVLSAAVLTAEEDKSFVGLDIFGGATFEFGDNWDNGDGSMESGLNMLGQVMSSLRVGGGADLYFRIADPLSVGVEAGIFVFATQDENGNTNYTPLLDIPVRATVRLSSGSLGLQIHGGYNFSTTFDALAASTNYMEINHKLDLGGRVFLGPLYVEYSRLFWTADAASLSAGSNRIGLGLNFNLF